MATFAQFQCFTKREDILDYAVDLGRTQAHNCEIPVPMNIERGERVIRLRGQIEAETDRTKLPQLVEELMKLLYEFEHEPTPSDTPAPPYRN